MLPPAPTTGILIMALWQFIVIVALFGAVLFYAVVLTSGMRRVNAALGRIEEALLAKGGPITPVDAQTPVDTIALIDTGTPADTAGTEATPAPELPGKPNDATRLLTIRDLKVRSEQERLRATRSEGHHSLMFRDKPRSCDPLTTHDEPPSAPIALSESADPVVAPSESPDSPNTIDELLSTPETETPIEKNANAVVSTHEIHDAQNTSDGLPSAPDPDPEDNDSEAKKEKDTLLLLSGQRRRRRARQGH